MASPALPQASPKLTTIDLVGGIYCSICHITFKNKKDYDTHYYKHDVGKEEIVYTCVVCHKDIAGYPSFRGHCYTNHVIKNRFKCDFCNKLFSKLSALNDHYSSLHKFECSSCKREFPSKKELQLHKIIHMNDKPPFPCQTCNEKLSCVDACEQHIDEHSLSLYTCPICNEKADNKPDAINHLTIHFDDVLNDSSDESDCETPEKPEDSSIDLLGGIFCIICETIHKNRAEIDQHFSHDHADAEVVYSCVICGNRFDKYVQFGSHCYEHITKNRFKCESCARTFSRLARLVSHTAEAHGAARAPRRLPGRGLPCHQPACQLTFESPKELVLHQQSHGGGRWCRQCGLALRSRAAAARHLDVHRKKSFACPVCARRYGEKYLLLKHVPQHFEAVFHVCKVCGNLYTAKNRLIAHSKTHANVKNYNCSYCTKGFTSLYKLNQHLNMHTGLRPYGCVACPKTFANYSNWSKHLQKMHKIDPKTVKKSHPKPEDGNAKENVSRNSELDKSEIAVNPVAPDNIESVHNELDDKSFQESEDLQENHCIPYATSFSHYSNLCKHIQKVHNVHSISEDEPKENLSNSSSDMSKIDMNPIDNIEIGFCDELDVKNYQVNEALLRDSLFLEPEGLDLDSINPSIGPGCISEFTLLPPAASFVSEGQGVPREYGPDCLGRLLALDDALPAVDPRLMLPPLYSRLCPP